MGKLIFGLLLCTTFCGLYGASSSGAQRVKPLSRYVVKLDPVTGQIIEVKDTASVPVVVSPPSLNPVQAPPIFPASPSFVVASSPQIPSLEELADTAVSEVVNFVTENPVRLWGTVATASVFGALMACREWCPPETGVYRLASACLGKKALSCYGLGAGIFLASRYMRFLRNDFVLF